MKKLISIRISPATDKKIERLKQDFSTQTEIIAIAIEKLYQEVVQNEKQ